MVDMRCDFLRMAVREPHRVEARCLRAGRTLALADVQIAPWDRPGRAVAVGRAQLAPHRSLMFRRNRFGDLISRQLDIYGEENADLLVEIAEYRERWRRASRTGAEEAFGDEQDRVDWAAEALSDLCDRYAAILDEATEAGVPPSLHEGRATALARAGRRCSKPRPIPAGSGYVAPPAPPLCPQGTAREDRRAVRSPRFDAVYGRSIDDPEGFWGEAARALDWDVPPRRVLDRDASPLARWFPDGRLNTCHNALDRHADGGRGDQAALIYDSPVTGTRRTYTLRRAARRGRAARRRAAEPRRRARRPRRPLPADGAAGADGHAGLRAPGRDPFGRVRRLRGARARRAHRRRPAARRAVRVLRPRGGAHGRLQAPARRSAGRGRARARALRDPAAPAARGLAGGGPRSRLGRARRRSGAGRVRAGAGDRSALHPLHLGHDGPSQGRGARQRRPRGRARVEHAERLRRAPRRGLLGGLATSAGWSGTPTSSTRRCSSARRPSSTRASRSARPTRARSGG